MKLQTLIGLLFMLLSHNKVTCKDIMRRFEISKSTALRYVDALTLANIPVIAAHGRNGGYYISGEYKLRCGFFTEEELSLVLSAMKNYENDPLHAETALSVADKLTALK